MGQAMTPSQMTEEQINKAVANYRAMLVKHAPDLALNAVQHVLGSKEFAGNQFGLFRSRVEAVSNMIIRHVTVNRTRTPMEAINATGRNKYVNDNVVATMPRGGGSEVDVFFFQLISSHYMNDVDLDKEYKLCGLKPVDPYTLAAVNEADPTFADGHPNGTHWQDAVGNWCLASFCRVDSERRTCVVQRDSGWCDRWWLAGLLK